MNHVLFTCTIVRQSWALCNFPIPENGFDPFSIYSNIYYVLQVGKNQSCPYNIRRSGPWIMWSIWKNRNCLLFNGSLSVGSTITRSIFVEIDHWFLVKDLEDQERATDLERKKRIIFGWKPPHVTWLKCDIGYVWDKNRFECEASWILRNSDGKVLLRGRRSFNNILSKTEYSFESWSWAIKNMKSLHFDNIIFSSEDHTLVGALSKPAVWPALKFYYLKLSSLLNNCLSWRVESQSRQALNVAFRIAK